MAQPISFQPLIKDGPAETERLRTAPAEHAEALLSAYELLQVLHDKGVLSLLRGAVAAGNELVGTITAAVDRPESIRAIRNFILLTQFFGAMPPEVLATLVQTVRAGAEREKPRAAPGLFHLIWRLRSKESRRAMAVGLDLLEGLGRGL
jgi:uncharacterized protein YjgD (DUF1641 family)